MKSIIIFICILSLSFSNSISFVEDGVKFIKGEKGLSKIDNFNSIRNVGKLSHVTQKHLTSLKVENIQNLMNMAVKENRISYRRSFRYISKFDNIENGDSVLLTCLKNKKCNLQTYTDIIINPPTPLHYQLLLKNPNLSLPQLNIKVGIINENLMNKYFQSTGWTKIEGEIGRNGIDGLFLKRRNGVIIDVLIVESKYNKSGLQHTQNGQQMTKQWVSKKVDDLIKQYPENSDYVTIKKYVDSDIYRAMLWNMKTTDESLLITLKHIHDKIGKAVPTTITGSSKMKINYQGNQEINIKNPVNDFHKQITNWYKTEIN